MPPAIKGLSYTGDRGIATATQPFDYLLTRPTARKFAREYAARDGDQPKTVGVATPSRGIRVVAETTRDRVLQLYQENPERGPTEIAAACGVTRQRIDQIAKELGITFKTRHSRNKVDVTPPQPPRPEEIRKWRRDHGDITQGTLAAMLGVSKDTVARWERGLRPIPAMVSIALQGLETGSDS